MTHGLVRRSTRVLYPPHDPRCGSSCILVSKCAVGLVTRGELTDLVPWVNITKHGLLIGVHNQFDDSHCDLPLNAEKIHFCTNVYKIDVNSHHLLGPCDLMQCK